MSGLLRKLLLAFGYVLVGASGIAFLAGSQCIYVSGHCDDDDDAFDDDDDHCDDDDLDDVSTLTEGDPPAAALIEAEDALFRTSPRKIAVFEEPGFVRVNAPQGRAPSLLFFEGVDHGSTTDLRFFCQRVLLANAHLLGWKGLPRLRFLGIEEVQPARWVRFLAEDGWQASVLLGPAGEVLAFERVLSHVPASR